MKHIKKFEEMGEGAYSGPPLTGGMNGTGFLSKTLAGGGSDGVIAGDGYHTKDDFAKPFPDKFKPNVTQSGKKDSKKRKDAIKKLDRLSKMMSFDDFQKEKEK